ncbi:hypothetical protein J7E99_26490 [Streptomyces sp. ISL-44]|nr:STAS domain-containing protein [Streptomyces sp. ISL-44]MBT2544156.1 hypothetical protein [Streptomyces sp. ISL-44]
MADSAGIGELVSIHKTVASRSGKLRLVNLTAKVGDFLTVSQLISVFEDFESEDEAVASF